MTAVTVITTACVLATSITVIAAPMKQDIETVQKKITLPSAGINKVVANYAELAPEAEIAVLAADLSQGTVQKTASAKKSSVKPAKEAVKTTKTEEVTEPATEAVVYEEPVIEEQVYEEPVYEEPVYEEPVYEEPVYEEPVYEEPVYEEPVIEEIPEETAAPEDVYIEPELSLMGEESFFEEGINEEGLGEETSVAEEGYAEGLEDGLAEEESDGFIYEESTLDTIFAEDTSSEEVVEEETTEVVEYEEETLEQFLEEQDQAIEEQAQEKAEAQDAATASDDDVYLGETIAQDACQYVGWLPYVWAGDSLETGADCSGFTMAVYAKYGYSLSHDSNVQSCEGRGVSLDEALPGDIIVYSGHVAMYIGDGQVVHSPHPGVCVSIADVNMMPVLDVRRIIE